jgi:ribosomal protein S27AE
MGGYNSGRYGWRGVVEQRKRLDIREFRRRGWLRSGSSGTLHWSRDGEPDGSIDIWMDHNALHLEYTVGADDEREQVEQRIAIERVACRYGGYRPYWRCPRCGRRIEVVIMATHGRWWGCQRCMRLRYVSQGLAPADRMQRRADAIYARAGTESDDGTSIRKHKWMRWRTFNRLMDRGNELGRYSDALFLLRLRRFGFADGSIDDAIASILVNDKDTS